MRYKLAILLNGIAQIEYDRNIVLDAKLADYLDNMDQKMDNGITTGEQQIKTPTTEQKAEFVASNLYHTIKGDNEAMASAMTSYLAVRIAELKQVKFDDKQENKLLKRSLSSKFQQEIVKARKENTNVRILGTL